MRFESLIMKNFMRYKGVNEITFSTDKDKNVTVVLGDNTVGKTTIAQAFRWCLYGRLMMPKGKSENEYVLLNQTVLEQMKESSIEKVEVIIVLADDEKRYRVQRWVRYRRKVPTDTLIEYQKNFQLFMTEREREDGWEEVGADENDVRRQETIKNIVNELLPDKLSHYFLFDGEKWSDFEYSGTRENIKESVHILTGLSAMKAAMYHLKDLNANSVIGHFRKKIQGSGAVADDIQRDIERETHNIEQWKQKIRNIQINIDNHQNKCRQIEAFLIDNQNTEALQKEFAAMKSTVQSKRGRAKDAYWAFMLYYSNKAYMLAAEPIVRTVLGMMENVDLERRDIPYMKQATIDFLIQRGQCICGNCIEKDGEAYRCLMEQRRYLPPADIGSLLGDFEKESRRMTLKNGDYYEQLAQEAERVSRCAIDLEETENRFLKMEKQLDQDINFKEYREQLKFHRSEIGLLEQEKSGLDSKIQQAQRTIENKERQMETLALQNRENEKWRLRVDMAKEIYDTLDKNFTSKQNKVFLELNKRLQSNFYRMFNAHDKKIELDKNYNIRMYYRTDNGFREETNLSEGEKVARNFAFIVTILEFNQEQKAEGDKFSDTLPIVLDGPFSKLGDENIQLVAGCLPEIAEQVILFMLEKDWKYTKLDNYVGAKYRIVKESEQSFAEIRRMEE